MLFKIRFKSMSISVIDVSNQYNLDAEFFIIENFLLDPEILVRDVIDNVNFEQFFTHTNKPVPRLIQHFGKEYNYYNIHHPEKDIPPFLEYLKNEIEYVTQHDFNSVLINFYPNEKSNISWHSDNEQCLGYNPFIASYTLGQTRNFLLRHKKTLKEYVIELKHNDLLLMGHLSQIHYEHSLPKHLTKCSPRINITLRHII